jgi:hypothetical protein
MHAYLRQIRIGLRPGERGKVYTLKDDETQLDKLAGASVVVKGHG